MQCPCQECPHRMLRCHDMCEEYVEYHDALLAAKEALKVANSAIGFLREQYGKRKRRWDRRAK